MEEIKRFMETYWKWPTLDLNKNQDEQIDKEEKFMLKQYGEETIKRRNFLIEEYCHCSPDREQELRDNITAFDYATGICEDAYLRPNLRSKKTLEMLLSFFSSSAEELIIADAGCGDGKITLGMAAYLNNLKKIYAIDKNQAAIDRFKRIISDSQLPPRITDKIVLIKGDYTSKTIQQGLTIGKGMNYVLALYSFPTIRLTMEGYAMGLSVPKSEFIKSLGGLVSPERESLLLIHEFNPLALMQRAGYDEEESLKLISQDSVLNDLNEMYTFLLQYISSGTEISFRSISFRKIAFDLAIALNIGTLGKNKGDI